MTGPGRQTRFALDIVETHREGRWFCIDVRGECKSAQCDQEGLRSNGIGDRADAGRNGHIESERLCCLEVDNQLRAGGKSGANLFSICTAYNHQIN